MNLFRSTFFVKVTLLFFITMLFFNPAYAQQGSPISYGQKLQSGKNDFPVTYINQPDVEKVLWELQKKGYVVKEGTLAELDQLMQNDNEHSQENIHEVDSKGEKKTECVSEEAKIDEKNEKQDERKSVEKLNKEIESSSDDDAEIITSQDKGCNKDTKESEATQQPSQEEAIDPPSDPSSTLPAEQYPTSEPRVHLGLHADLSFKGGSSNRDSAKVFFIFVGLAVVAAFVVYAGKYIADLVRGENLKVWREFIFNNTFLSTGPGRHGQFSGAKIATGFVSNELIQLALVGEIGNANLDLILNETVDPTPLDFSATYWMLGASARLHLTDKFVNASYLYMEFMGGTTSHSDTDIIGATRVGASFGINDYLRLGASMGAQYIGLDSDQGFANDGDNYWVTYGVEIGMRF